ncbi:hypothetical protein [Phenylobacterium sp.]|jgi:hypothetical protein|uniref:hypothetical protein n=1 Tax=Phenylobacterium sp. TaxID=1871053 RepID=UPI003784E301
MVRLGRALLIVALSASVGACESGARKDAAAAAQALFSAVVARDRMAFEAAVDRRAVREDLRGQLVEVARAQGLEVDGGPSEFALDRMIGPDAFRLIDGSGMPLMTPPSAEAVTPLVELEGRRRACVKDAAGLCRLVFARQKSEDGDHWRLVAMPAGDLVVRLDPAVAAD